MEQGKHKFAISTLIALCLLVVLSTQQLTFDKVFFASNALVNTDATFANSHIISDSTEQNWPHKSSATYKASENSILFAIKQSDNQFNLVQYNAAAITYIKEEQNAQFKGFIAITATNAIAAHEDSSSKIITLSSIKFGAIVATSQQNWTSILAVEQVSPTVAYLLATSKHDSTLVELVHVALSTLTVSTVKSFTAAEEAAFVLKQIATNPKLTYKKTAADYYFVDLPITETAPTTVTESKITLSAAPTEIKPLANVAIAVTGTDLIAFDGTETYKLQTLDAGSTAQQAILFNNNLYLVITKLGSCKIYKSQTAPSSVSALSFDQVELSPTARLLLVTPKILAVQSGENIFTISEAAAAAGSLHPEKRRPGRLVGAFKNSLLIEQVGIDSSISLITQENDAPHIITTVLASNQLSIVTIFYQAIILQESAQTAKILFFMRVKSVATATNAGTIYANEIRAYCDGNTKCNAHGRCGGDQCFCFASANQGFWTGDKCDSCLTDGLALGSNCTRCTVASHAAPVCAANACFGKNETDPMICGGHGRCIAADKCECEDNYSGTNCEDFECYGYLKNDARVCSYSGKCVDFNDCQCLPGFSGYNCKEWRQDDYLWILIIFMIFASGFLVVILLLAVGFLYRNKQPAMSSHRPVLEDGEDFVVPSVSSGNGASANVQAQHSGAWVELHEDNDDDDIVGLDEVHSQ